MPFFLTPAPTESTFTLVVADGSSTGTTP